MGHDAAALLVTPGHDEARAGRREGGRKRERERERERECFF